MEHVEERFYQIKEGQLLAGAYPGSYTEQEAREKIDWLLNKGVTFFLDLTYKNEMKPYAVFLPQDIVHQRMAIIDMGIPSKEQMTLILDTIDAQIAAGQTVYVHCWAGRGRTGTTVGCYLVRHGLSGQEALDEIVRLRDGRTDSPEAASQYDFVRNWSE
jgi:protein tyrosine/serine phosphatase